MSNKTVNTQYMVDERCNFDKTETLLVVLAKKERSSECRAVKLSRKLLEVGYPALYRSLQVTTWKFHVE